MWAALGAEHLRPPTEKKKAKEEAKERKGGGNDHMKRGKYGETGSFAHSHARPGKLHGEVRLDP